MSVGNDKAVTHSVTPEELVGGPDQWLRHPLTRTYFEMRRAPRLAVLDTDHVRTGLDCQLRKGQLPASVAMARDGALRLFMEHDTLLEAREKMPKFARDLDLDVAELTRLLNGWLPYIRVVKVSEPLRSLDARARAVMGLDGGTRGAALTLYPPHRELQALCSAGSPGSSTGHRCVVRGRRARSG
jgi:hypothetical protein